MGLQSWGIPLGALIITAASLIYAVISNRNRSQTTYMEQLREQRDEARRELERGRETNRHLGEELKSMRIKEIMYLRRLVGGDVERGPGDDKPEY